MFRSGQLGFFREITARADARRIFHQAELGAGIIAGLENHAARRLKKLTRLRMKQIAERIARLVSTTAACRVFQNHSSLPVGFRSFIPN